MLASGRLESELVGRGPVQEGLLNASPEAAAVADPAAVDCHSPEERLQLSSSLLPILLSTSILSREPSASRPGLSEELSKEIIMYNEYAKCGANSLSRNSYEWMAAG